MQAIYRFIAALALVVILVLCMPLLGTDVRLVPAVQAQESDEAEHGCTLATLKGTWGFVFNGTIIGFGPIAVVGLATFDGAGHWSRDERAVVNGNVLRRELIAGTYTVDSDCTGTTSDSTGNSSDFVLVAHHKEMFAIGTGPGSVATITLKKQ
jgi:hypothetical protein